MRFLPFQAWVMHKIKVIHSISIKPAFFALNQHFIFNFLLINEFNLKKNALILNQHFFYVKSYWKINLENDF